MVVDDADSTDPDAEPLRAASFTEFYEQQYRAVVRLAIAVVGRRDVAEELVQDAFIALHGRWTRVSQYEAPELWLRRVVLNRSLSALRRRTVEVRLLARLARQRPRLEDPPVADGELWRAVGELPKRQAQVVALMFVDDLSVSQIAKVLECDENTVRTHLRRARHGLAQRLDLEEESGS